MKKRNKNVCSFCGKPLNYLPYVCRYCGESFCVKHRLPERHKCEGLEKWKRGELKKFKKPIKSIKTAQPFLEPMDWMDRIKPKRRIRINTSRIILIVIIGIVCYFLYVSYQSGKIQSLFQSVTEDIATWWNESSDHEETYIDSGNYLGCSVIQIQYNYKTSMEDSKATIEYLNKIRKQYGKKEISFDERVFELAIARAKDMRTYNYLDHTNPFTGTCPDSMKTDYGLKPYEYVAENCYGNPVYSEDECTKIEIRPMTEAIDDWMISRGHRYNLLYDGHIAGAVGCYKNMCTFLGLNYDRFGEGCHTAKEGQEFWGIMPKQPGEVS